MLRCKYTLTVYFDSVSHRVAYATALFSVGASQSQRGLLNGCISKGFWGPGSFGVYQRLWVYSNIFFRMSVFNLQWHGGVLLTPGSWVWIHWLAEVFLRKVCIFSPSTSFHNPLHTTGDPKTGSSCEHECLSLCCRPVIDWHILPCDGWNGFQLPCI